MDAGHVLPSEDGIVPVAFASGVHFYKVVSEECNVDLKAQGGQRLTCLCIACCCSCMGLNADCACQDAHQCMLQEATLCTGFVE